MNTVVENPRPIELEQPKPIDIQRPLKYTETINIPVDEKGSESNLNTNVNNNNNNDVNNINSEPKYGLQDLSEGYEPHKIQKKA